MKDVVDNQEKTEKILTFGKSLLTCEKGMSTGQLFWSDICLVSLSVLVPPSLKELVIEFLSGYGCLVGILKLRFLLFSNIPSLYLSPRRVSLASSCQRLPSSYWIYQTLLEKKCDPKILIRLDDLH